MNTMNRKVAMCSQLNMNFDEANELFGEESLESMQMARVNGGVLDPVSIVTIIGTIASLVGVGYTIYQDQKELPADGPTRAYTSESELKTLLEGIKPGMTATFDSIIGDKLYGIRIVFQTPTPAS